MPFTWNWISLITRAEVAAEHAEHAEHAEYAEQRGEYEADDHFIQFMFNVYTNCKSTPTISPSMSAKAPRALEF